MISRRSALLVLFFLFSLISASCREQLAPPSSSPTTPSTHPTQPRLVVLSPALAVTLTDLSLAHLIVGRHGYDLALDPAIPVCGDQSGIDYEALIRANPTDVLIEWGARPLPARLEELAKVNRWNIRNFTLLTLDDIRTSTEELWRAYATLNLAKAESPRARLDQAWSARTPPLAAAGRVLLLLSASPPAALGPGSFHHQILTAIGGTPALTSGSPYIELDAEDVLKLDPDVIVFVISRATTAQPRAAKAPLTDEEIATLLGPLSKVNLRAARDRNIVLLDDPFALLPSTAMARLADQLAHKLADQLAGSLKPRDNAPGPH